jgi:photosystem II stability/assembly factor-like uncharacterized protein
MAALALACVAVAAPAAVPQKISYQGTLADANGLPATGCPCTVRFRLYDDPTAGNLVHDETQSVAVTNGIFNVTLGTNPPITAAFDKPYWLLVSVGGQDLAPRQPLATSAYAFTAATANALASGATVAGAIAWTVASGNAMQAAANSAYLVTGATRITFTLPVSPAPGDVVKIFSPGLAGFTIQPNPGQSISGAGVVEPMFVARSAPQLQWTGIASSADGSRLAAVALNSPSVLTSADGGVTWTPGSAIGPGATAVASSADGNKLAVVVQGGLVWLSPDGGQTWGASANSPTQAWTSIASSADGSKLVAVGAQAAIYTSGDGGQTWTPRDQARNWSSVASSADGSRLVATDNGGMIYTSTDSGQNWSPHDSARAWRGAASSADGNRLAVVVQGGLVYTSPDGGVSWTGRESPRSWSGIASSADGTRLAAAVSGGGIFVSIDGGASWSVRESARTWSGIASSADGSKLGVVVQGGLVFNNPITSVSGGGLATAELVYAGGGVWAVASHTGSLLSP